jgi:hypothetical protein
MKAKNKKEKKVRFIDMFNAIKDSEEYRDILSKFRSFSYLYKNGNRDIEPKDYFDCNLNRLWKWVGHDNLYVIYTVGDLYNYLIKKNEKVKN